MIYRPIHEIDDVRWKEVGAHVSQSVGLDSSESIISAFVVHKLTDDRQFVLATKAGQIKQVNLANLQPNRTYKSKPQAAMKLKAADDEVLQVYCVSTVRAADYQVVSATHLGYGVRYPLAEVPAVGAKAAGVKAMDLKDDDYVVDYILTNEATDNLGILTQRGAYKHMHLTELPVSSRARRGLLILRELKRQPHRVFAIFKETKDAQLQQHIEITTDRDEIINVPLNAHNFGDRYSNGTFVVDTETQGQLADAQLVKAPIEIETDLDL